MAMTDTTSVVIQSISRKMKDLEIFSIPFQLGTMCLNREIYDLGASVSLMPLFVCKSLGIREMKLTNVSLQLADGSVKYLIGVLEYVPVKVGYLYSSSWISSNALGCLSLLVSPFYALLEQSLM